MKKCCLLLTLLALLFAVPAFSHSSPPVPSPTPPPEAVKTSILDLGRHLVLVNREHRISKTYIPQDLVLPRVATRKESLQEQILMTREAAQALEALFEAALMEEGHVLYAVSGYRSYGIQQILFNTKVQEVGSRERAQRRVALAGTSEHQLGLAIDLQAPSHLNLSQAFGDTEEGKWAGENAHRFGFILRYKTAWRDLTGISDEPWHFRYVGIAHATAMHQLDIPFETYVTYARMLPEYVLTGGSHVLLAGLIADLMAEKQPEALQALQKADEAGQESALRQATAPYLTGQSYEQALWYSYPTPKPTAEPWVDADEEEVLLHPSGSN
ncbi:MAG: M15 family metallopeptidase [Clostridiales bacterium]|jgi:LAS superfamily LD-carboxypeptidase LdcB|nr:M15 family metallopeptidase [Clostridiales bacterium]